MCGIAGVVGVATTTVDDVRGMIRAIQYRGKDEEGVQQLGKATIGHVRLAVVDRENGMQPMCNEDSSVWVTFNGEIFNFVELREQLKAKGHTFKSRCDTEVLLHLWEEKGVAMLDDLIGMFAFFIWDKRKGTGMLARDRQGIKPCFYAKYKGGVAFSSEIKALLTLPNFERRVNEQALGNVFSFNYCPPPDTCFEGVYHLPPGSYMTYENDAWSPIVQYWTWPFMTERETPSYEKFNALMDSAINLQMRFDVEGGLFMSGGLDSSVVAAKLGEHWNRPEIDSISLKIEEKGFSEYQYAEYAARRYPLNLIPLEIQSADIAAISEDVVRHAEQPHGDFSFYLVYLLARAAHQQGKIVMFNGDGPDEVMLGFRHNETFFSSITRTNFSMRSYFDTICYMTTDERKRIMTSAFLPHTDHAFERFKQLIEPWSDLEPMEQVAAYEVSSLMPGNNLVKADRMGACWSIEGRSPFLDHRVSELFAKLPVPEKYNQGVGKYYLKNVACNFYDKNFVFRPKTMPTLPIGEWIKGPLFSWARDILSLPDGGRFNQNEILLMLEENRSGLHNHTRQLRTLLMTKLWLKEFFPQECNYSVVDK